MNTVLAGENTLLRDENPTIPLSLHAADHLHRDFEWQCQEEIRCPQPVQG